MKKLSVLIALMLCVTVGGVYAVWSYAGSTDIIDKSVESKVVIADVKTETANGVYTIESNLVLTVDQANDNHEAKLVFGSNNAEDPMLKVTFVANSHAPEAIKTNAVPSDLKFTLTTPMQYKMDASGNYDENGTPEDIFVLTDHDNIVWTKEGNAFVCVLDQTELESHIQLNGTFKLDLKSEHDAFGEALAGNIKATVTDRTVN
ncbi:MAG: hypothetical protein IJZ21_00135 [Clostridia bacterium]|nr:hypothetical protein [Clostridia bacterium]